MDYVIAVPGSVHDSSAFQLAEIVISSNRFLEDGEWIWADSAYGCHPWCVVPFKKPSEGRDLSRDQKKFNYYLSKVSG